MKYRLCAIVGIVLCIACPAVANDAAQRALLQAIRQGDGVAAGEALKAGASAMGAGGEKNASAAELATVYADESVILALDAAGADWTKVSVRGWNALELVLSRSHTSAKAIAPMLKAGLRVRKDVIGYPALGTPASVSNGEVMRALLDAGADPNEKSDAGRFVPIVVAAWRGTGSSIRELVAAGAKVDKEGAALRLAGTRRDDGVLGVFQALRDAGYSLTGPDESGWTPLQIAIYSRSPEAIRALVACGVSVRGSAPLCIAAQRGDAATVRALLDAGADPNETDERGQTALGWLMRAASPKMRMEWAQHGVEKSATTLHEALARIESMDVLGIAKALLNAGANPNTHPDTDWPPLALAVSMWSYRGLMEIADEARPQGISDLRRVRFLEGHKGSEIVELLIKAGARRKRSRSAPDPIVLAGMDSGEDARQIVGLLRAVPLDVQGEEPLEHRPDSAAPHSR